MKDTIARFMAGATILLAGVILLVTLRLSSQLRMMNADLAIRQTQAEKKESDATREREALRSRIDELSRRQMAAEQDLSDSLTTRFRNTGNMPAVPGLPVERGIRKQIPRQPVTWVDALPLEKQTAVRAVYRANSEYLRASIAAACGGNEATQLDRDTMRAIVMSNHEKLKESMRTVLDAAEYQTFLDSFEMVRLPPSDEVDRERGVTAETN